MSEWIPVAERLPEKCGRYLVALGGKYVHVTDYDPDGWDIGPSVTHWMPLPQPPEER